MKDFRAKLDDVLSIEFAKAELQGLFLDETSNCVIEANVKLLNEYLWAMYERGFMMGMLFEKERMI